MGEDKLLGALELLALRVLERGAAHGFAIAERVRTLSGEALRVEEGSLYPALHRMEEAGLIRAEWALSENRRRARFYRLTARGRQRLARERERWTRTAAAVARVLERA